MKSEHLLTAFFLFSTGALLLTWFYVTKRAQQVTGAAYGIPGSDTTGTLMAALLVVWFILAVTVAIFNRPEHHD